MRGQKGSSVSLTHPLACSVQLCCHSHPSTLEWEGVGGSGEGRKEGTDVTLHTSHYASLLHE